MFPLIDSWSPIGQLPGSCWITWPRHRSHLATWRPLIQSTVKCIFFNECCCILTEISWRFVPVDGIDNKSALVLSKTWCLQAICHHMRICWSGYVPYDVTMPHRVSIFLSSCYSWTWEYCYLMISNLEYICNYLFVSLSVKVVCTPFANITFGLFMNE